MLEQLAVVLRDADHQREKCDVPHVADEHFLNRAVFVFEVPHVFMQRNLGIFIEMNFMQALFELINEDWKLVGLLCIFQNFGYFF